MAKVRQRLGPEDTVEVTDWADTGPLFYGQRNDDGERPINRPRRAAVVVLYFAKGDSYILPVHFGEHFEVAEKFAERIRRFGSVNLTLWHFWRVVYGSPAYEAGGYEDAYAAAEREVDGWLDCEL